MLDGGELFDIDRQHLPPAEEVEISPRSRQTRRGSSPFDNEVDVTVDDRLLEQPRVRDVLPDWLAQPRHSFEIDRAFDEHRPCNLPDDTVLIPWAEPLPEA